MLVQCKTLPQTAVTPLPEETKGPSIAIAVLCIVLVALTLRPGIVSIGPLLPEIIQELGLSYIQAALLTSIPTLLMGALAIPAPWLAHRFGRDRVILAALLVLGASIGLRTLVGSIGQLFFATAGVGAGIAIAGTLLSGYVKARFPTKVAIFMGLYTTSIALGSTLAAASTGPLAEAAENWRWAAGFWVLPVALAIGAWLFIERNGRQKRASGALSAAPRLPLRNPTAWLIALFFACNNLVFYAMIAWLAPIYIELGNTPTAAGMILAGYTLGFMVATPLFGFISRNDDRRIVLAVSAGIALLGSLAIAVAPNTLPMLWVPLAAFGTGGAFTLAMTLPLDNASTPEEAGAWSAFVMLPSYIVAAVGPLLVGFLRDIGDSFHLSLWVLVVIGAVMLLVTPFLKPNRNNKVLISP
ncbi:MFS transporter [Rheinheimera oceanensis]|uniref:MFS transporter n=1 Tax=Rheinheimera oceanensis TaxID=2817449 RepID=UPI001BFDE590|nr:MFS transporter [Rheinheimera oceanensis]